MNYTITANIDKEIFLRFFHIATNIAILINKRNEKAPQIDNPTI